MAAPVRIRILRNSVIEGHGEAKAGEEFEVSPYTAAMLASVGTAAACLAEKASRNERPTD